MPLTDPVNTRWYKDFNGERGWKFRLNLYIGDNTDIPTVPIARSLPDFIFEKITIKAGYDTHAVGMPLASLMDLEMNLEPLQSKYSSVFDYDLLNYYIHNGGTGNSRTVNSKSVVIPNIWFLQSNNGDGTTNYTKYEFIGCQENRPEQEEELNEEKVNFKISIVSIDRSILERIKPSELWDQMILTAGAYWPVYKLYDFAYTGIPNVWVRYYYSDTTLLMSTPVNIMGVVETMCNNLYQALWRRTDRVLDTLNTPTYPLTFYTTNHSTLTQTYSSSLGSHQIYYILSQSVKGEAEAGILKDGNRADSIFTQYDNLWDMFKTWTENHFCKVWYDINSTSGTDQELNWKFLRVFDSTEGAGITLTSKDVVGNMKIRKAGEIIIKGISHLKGAEGKDLSTVVYLISGTQAEKAFETDLLIHNHSVGFQLENETATAGTIQEHREDTPVFNIFCANDLWEYNDFVRVNEYCTLDLDSTNQITSDSAFDDLSMGYKTTGDELRKYFTTRSNLAGLGYVFAKAGAEVYGNDNQAILEIEVRAEKALPRMIGDNYSVTVSDFYPSGYTPTLPYKVPADYPSGNAVLIETECDILKCTAKTKFFLRGD